MYQIGDIVVYGVTGVCRIMDISMKSIANTAEQLYYSIKPLYQECIIYAPVENNKVFMRPVIDKNQADALIEAIPTMHAEIFQSNATRELSEHYEASLKSHNCKDLIELTMSIYAKKQLVEQQKRKFGAVDERFMRRAEELLFGELAVALDIPKESVRAYIEEKVNNR